MNSEQNKAEQYLKENADIHYDEDLPCVEYDEVIGLMQDFAKQEAIEFLKFDDKAIKYKRAESDYEMLYQKFKES